MKYRTFLLLTLILISVVQAQSAEDQGGNTAESQAGQNSESGKAPPKKGNRGPWSNPFGASGPPPPEGSQRPTPPGANRHPNHPGANRPPPPDGFKRPPPPDGSKPPGGYRPPTLPGGANRPGPPNADERRGRSFYQDRGELQQIEEMKKGKFSQGQVMKFDREMQAKRKFWDTHWREIPDIQREQIVRLQQEWRLLRPQVIKKDEL